VVRAPVVVLTDRRCASGTISDGTTNFALLPLQFADIGRATMGGVTVSG
jgi:hypothetical protein